MRENTVRTRIRKTLENSINGVNPDRLSNMYEIDESDVLSHISHIQKSLNEQDSRILVRPPECMNCEFDKFDDKLNIPSNCPKCRSNRIQQPAFKIITTQSDS